MVSYENASGSVATRFRELGLRTRWARRSSSMATCGARQSSARRNPLLYPPIPRHASGTLPIWCDRDRQRPDPRPSRRARRATGSPAAGGDVGRARGTAVRGVLRVAGELARCLGVHHSTLFRYEPDGTATLLAARHEPELKTVPIGKRFSFEGDNIAAMVYDTGRTARIDSHDNAAGLAATVHPSDRHSIGRWSADHRRRPAVGRGHRRLVSTRAAATRHRGARRGLRGSGRDCDRQCPDPRRAHSLSGPDRRCLRRRPAPYRTRSARRRPTAADLTRARAAHRGDFASRSN